MEKQVKKTAIVFLVIFSVIFIISAVGLISAINLTLEQARIYPVPIDSFWTLEGSIILLIICSLLLSLSVIGIVFSLAKIKHNAKTGTF